VKHRLFCLIIILFSCWNAPAINTKYDFSQINNIKLKKIEDHSYEIGSGQIMEDNLSFMFMKHGYDVSQTEKNGTIINLNENAKSSLLLTCTLTEFTDRETILVPYRIENRGSTETIVTQSTEAGKKDDSAIATTSTTTTTDGGSLQESGRIEYTQARVGIFLKMIDENSGLLVWSHSYWYSGLELTRTAQVCAKNAVGLINQLLERNI
tara:strand:- start:91 stop:717 length:627 start_codon:yes stop_codon:yes gene_type:complete